MHHSSSQQGFVILFAVLISTIIMLIGISMFRISVKEIILSSTARESTMAFYAADSALECGLYNQVRLGVVNDQGGTFHCFDNQTFNFSGPFVNMRMGPGSTGCAAVQFSFNNGQTTITARGYNICSPALQQTVPLTSSPLLLERRLFIEY
ncbi:MAG: hypothetical protein LRY41_02605 [Candidatus Pacebacteria bacterium]|nr:hypothetical protein [Candidatus Paceibacterota bacterium]MCD8508175.1 hypothetical protein [Candidatus Paceibacterota bacterium]MCD8528191.1 hypothetical protein [Candidatus Paceibacterota bacterium]MCD8563462.1 hypothetical protein [Candidatus Paceibacterota bacterium]